MEIFLRLWTKFGRQKNQLLLLEVLILLALTGDSRHSHASLLINLGCDSREVTARLGDTVEVIERTYYHMFPDKKKHTIDVLNNFKKRGK